MPERNTSLARVFHHHAADFDLLSAFDRGELPAPVEAEPTATIDHSDVELLVAELRTRFPADSRLGLPLDDSIHAILAQVEQTFAGEPLYGTAQERAANLIYMVVKDHPFGDGNKRAGAALFAYFLDRNGINLGEAVPGRLLTAITLLVAASDPAKKDETVGLIRSLIAGG